MFSRVRQLGLCVLLILSSAAAHRDVRADQGAEEKLPVQRIVLFSSGVGFFEHRGTVEGNDEVDLQFKTDDINDLLKSLVLQDLGGGQISSVSYGSRDPITKTLQTFAIDLTEDPTLFDLLSQVRGQKLLVHAPEEISGIMVGAESRTRTVAEGEPVRVDYLVLLSDQGLRSIALNDVDRLEFADVQLQREFRAALKTLAAANATDKKTVTLKFLGQGRRPVRFGYIREAPVWKTSYRLVLRDGEPPMLQGWAIVENTSDQDWENVELSLVSGRPISFTMDLYSPLYASRPMVANQLYASLQPQLHDQAMGLDLLRSSVNDAIAASEPRRRAEARRGGRAYGMGGGGGGFGGDFGGEYDKARSGAEGELAELDISQGVDAVAEAGNVGELFRYDIATPISIKRQRSAMLPIIDQTIEADKVSIYNRTVHAKHPLNGVRVKNTSDLHLMQGPITMFDGGVYAGDGKIASLPADAQRLVSYALDLKVEVAPSSEPAPQKLVSVKLVNGMLHAEHQQLKTSNYVIKNSDQQEKTVIIEHPLQSNWKLVRPEKANESTRNRHRFFIETEPNKTSELVVKERRLAKQVVGIGKFGESQFEFYLSAGEVSQAVKAALRDIQQRLKVIADLAQQRQTINKELTVIESEQARIRKNMQQLPRDSQLYKRYVKKFSAQEDRVEQLRTKARDLSTVENNKRKSLNETIAALNIE